MRMMTSAWTLCVVSAAVLAALALGAAAIADDNTGEAPAVKVVKPAAIGDGAKVRLAGEGDKPRAAARSERERDVAASKLRLDRLMRLKELVDQSSDKDLSDFVGGLLKEETNRYAKLTRPPDAPRVAGEGDKPRASGDAEVAKPRARDDAEVAKPRAGGNGDKPRKAPGEGDKPRVGGDGENAAPRWGGEG